MELQAIHRIFAEAFNAGDLDRLMTLYEADAVLVAEPGHPVRGSEAIRAAFSRILAAGRKMRLTTITAF